MILVTGGTGFLGKYIVQELLADGQEVRVLVRNPEGRKLPSWHNMVEIAEGDVLDILSLEKAIDGVDYVIHAAAVVSFWKKDKAAMYKVNIEGTANIVDACLASGIEKLVHVSSIATMGQPMQDELINEETPLTSNKIKSQYAYSKRKAEIEVHRGIAEGMHAVMINPSVIIGADDRWDQGTPKIFSILNKGLRFYNSGANGFVGAQDVARACILLMKSNLPDGERYLISGNNMSYKDFFSLVAEKLGVDAPKYKLPALPSIWIGRISEALSYLTGKPPIISLASMRSGTMIRRFDTTKIQELGFTYTSMNKIVEETARKFKESNP